MLRYALKLTQASIAVYIGVNAKYISAIENGRVLPSRRLIVRLCEATNFNKNVAIRYLYQDHVERFSEHMKKHLKLDI